jgi:hypothetical protein
MRRNGRKPDVFSFDEEDGLTYMDDPTDKYADYIGYNTTDLAFGRNQPLSSRDDYDDLGGGRPQEPAPQPQNRTVNGKQLLINEEIK